MTATARTSTRHFSYATAAEEFGIPERWLRTHISSLPHRRFGRYVRFSEADMHAISDMHAATGPAPAVVADGTAIAFPEIRPSSRRRVGNM